MSKVSENKTIFVYKFSVSIFQQYMYYSYVVTLTIKKKNHSKNATKYFQNEGGEGIDI